MVTLRDFWPRTLADLSLDFEFSAEPRELQEEFGSRQLTKVEFLCQMTWILLVHGGRERQLGFLKNITRAEYDEMINHEFLPLTYVSEMNSFVCAEFRWAGTVQGFGYWSNVFDNIFPYDEDEDVYYEDDYDEVDVDDDDDDNVSEPFDEFPEFIV